MQVYPSQQAVFDTALGIAFSLSLLWLLSGTLYRTLIWCRAQTGLPIPLAPAPKTIGGVVVRLLLEVLLFRSLARASPITWIASMVFHYALLLVLLMHLRFVFPLLPVALLPVIQVSTWAAAAMVLALLVLLLRRILVDRVRYISSPSDYLHLVLILAIAFSGLLLKHVWPADLYQVGVFLRGTFTFDWQPLTQGMGLYLHLLLVLALMVIYPLSKLVHGLGVLFAPTFHQRDSGDSG